MPRGDGSGPQGAGTMTGRGAGYCAGNHVPGFQNGGAAFGKRGCRRGAGNGGNGAMRGAMNGAGMRGQHGNRFQFKQTGLTGWQRAGMAMNPAADADSQAALRMRADALQAELGHVQSLLQQPEGE